LVFAQTEEVVRGAVEHGWEAGLLAVGFLAIVAALWLIVRWLLRQRDRDSRAAEARETRMADRVTALEGFIREKLLDTLNTAASALQSSAETQKSMAEVIREHTRVTLDLDGAIKELAARISLRPCLLSEEARAEFMEEAAERMKAAVGQRLSEVMGHAAR
jgi:hypothetical protein